MDQQYFPQPGDDPGTIQAKLENRQDAIRGLIDSTGPLADQFELPKTPDASPVSNQGGKGSNQPKQRLRFNPQTGDFEWLKWK